MSTNHQQKRKKGLLTEEKPAGGLSQNDFGQLLEHDGVLREEQDGETSEQTKRQAGTQGTPATKP